VCIFGTMKAADLLTRTAPKHIGARSELIACRWLLDRSYEVLRNVSAFGPVDLAAVKPGEVLLLDVKTDTSGVI